MPKLEKIIYLGIIIALTGGILIICTAIPQVRSIYFLPILLQSVGSALLILGLLSLIWDTKMKEIFMEEIWAKAKLSEDIKETGIINAYASFSKVDWENIFRSAKEIDLFFSYAYTWRSNHEQKLERVAREGNRIRVILPDPEVDNNVQDLARRFGFDKDRVRDRIKDAKDFFQSKHQDDGAEIEIWFHDRTPLLSIYIFDDIGIFATFNHLQERKDVPTLVVQRGGTIYDFLEEEFDGIIRDHARKVFPEESN